MNLDDPKLTAYVLGELSENERRVIRAVLADAPEAQEFVRQTQETAQLLRGEFQTELREAARKPLNIMPLPMPRSFWSDARWTSVAVTALIAIFAVIAAVIVSNGRIDSAHRVAGNATAQPAANADVQMEIEAEMLVGVPGAPGENPFLPAAANPVSRISFNIGRDSYEKVRAGVNSGTKPPRDAVRLEQLINNFSYDYAVPALNENFSIHVASGACPWQPQHRLVRVAVKARKVARQVQLVASFNPDSTSTYRLLGYEDRSPSSDATGETVTAGQTLTALYEVEPTANQPSPLAPLLSVSLSYYSPTGSAKLVAQNSSIEDFGDDFARAPDDFKFAAAVAEFGMILRESPHKGNGSLASVLQWSNESKGRDEKGERAGFIELVRKAQSL